MAETTRRVSVRLSLDDAARVKQELREVGETGQRSLERIQGGADRTRARLTCANGMEAVRTIRGDLRAEGVEPPYSAGDRRRRYARLSAVSSPED